MTIAFRMWCGFLLTVVFRPPTMTTTIINLYFFHGHRSYVFKIVWPLVQSLPSIVLLNSYSPITNKTQLMQQKVCTNLRDNPTFMFGWIFMMTWLWSGLDAHPFELGSTIITWSEMHAILLQHVDLMFQTTWPLRLACKVSN